MVKFYWVYGNLILLLWVFIVGDKFYFRRGDWWYLILIRLFYFFVVGFVGNFCINVVDFIGDFRLIIICVCFNYVDFIIVMRVVFMVLYNFCFRMYCYILWVMVFIWIDVFVSCIMVIKWVWFRDRIIVIDMVNFVCIVV